MFIRIKKSPHNPDKINVQIVESVREGNNIKQVIVRHVGVARNEKELMRMKDLAEYIKAQIEFDHTPSLFTPEEVAKEAINARKRIEEEKEIIVDLQKLKEEQRINIGFQEIYGKVYEEIFGKVLKSRHGESADEILRNIVIARIANPQSKRESVRLLEEDFGIRIKLDKVYRMMNKLDEVTLDIQKKAYLTAQSVLNDKIDVIFFDATTLYFESFVEDELKQNGFSKDHKFNQAQVVLSLMVTKDGLPLGYDIFPGSTYESKTLINALDKIKEQYKIDKIIFVADAGMLQEKNLLLLDEKGYEYIISARLKNLSHSWKSQILSMPFTDNEIIDLSFTEKKRLVLYHSKERAKKSKKDREKAVGQLLKKIKRSKDPISLISNYGYKKYIKSNGKTEIEIDEKKLQKDEKWDGICGIYTNSKEINKERILEYYKGLWQVEESFRITKHDLKIRPIYHWTPERIKAHIAISFMAFSCVRLLEYRIKVQSTKLSPNEIRYALGKLELSILKDSTNQRYAVPSKFTKEAKQIYQVMGMKASSVPYRIVSSK